MFFVVIVIGVRADIECHYCGERHLCPLPYKEKDTERVNCQKSCMKFDGYSQVDNKRILVRGCGQRDINECTTNTTYFGAVGTTCLCNGINCNSAEIKLPSLFLCFIINLMGRIVA